MKRQKPLVQIDFDLQFFYGQVKDLTSRGYITIGNTVGFNDIDGQNIYLLNFSKFVNERSNTVRSQLYSLNKCYPNRFFIVDHEYNLIVPQSMNEKILTATVVRLHSFNGVIFFYDQGGNFTILNHDNGVMTHGTDSKLVVEHEFTKQPSIDLNALESLIPTTVK